MAHHHHGVPVTPFYDFNTRVNDLYDSDLAHNLRAWDPFHDINLALRQLCAANTHVRHEHGSSGPRHERWNVPRSPYLGHAHLNPPGHRRPSSPYTPPRTPVGSDTSHHLEQQLSDVTKKLAECNKLIASQKSELESQRASLESHRATLAATNKTVLEQEDALAGNTSTIKLLRERLAKQYLAAGRNRDAAEQYAQLEQLQKGEAQKRRSWHDRPGARAAEARELEFELLKGRALSKEGKYGEAERCFRHVLRRRKELFSDDQVQQKETREAQLLLCEALTKSGSSERAHEAEGIYLRCEPLVGLNGMAKSADCEWALSNIFALAQFYAEQKSYRLAVNKLSDAWAWRGSNNVSGAFRKDMHDAAMAVVATCEGHGQPVYAAKAFEATILHGITGVNVLSSPNIDDAALATLARLGIELYNTSKHDDKAASFLSQAWSLRHHTLLRDDPNAVRTIGWTLAMVRSHAGRWTDVRELLMALPARRTTNNGSTSRNVATTGSTSSDPSDDEILALLAHAQLHLHDLPGAAENSRALLKKHGVANLKTGFRWHHADTLIKALAMPRTGEDDIAAKQLHRRSGSDGGSDTAAVTKRFFEARDVWGRVYNAAVVAADSTSSVTLSEATRRDLKRHAEAGRVLADEWRRSATRRGKKPASADEVARQSEILRRLAGGTAAL